MKNKIMVLLALIFSLASSAANAWIVACNPDDLKRCHKSCAKAGGTIVKDHKDREWCQIPYRLLDANDPRAKPFQEAGMDVMTGKDHLDAPAKPRGTSSGASLPACAVKKSA